MANEEPGRTVRFTKRAVGRAMGHVERVYDETLAQDWVDAGVCEFVPDSAKVTTEPASPTGHRAITGPGKRRLSIGRRKQTKRGRRG